MNQDSQRMLNVGVVVELKSRGEKVTVKELSLEDILTNISALAEMVVTIDFSKEVDPMAFVVSIAQRPDTFELLKVLASTSTKTEKEYWNDVGVTDWVRVIRAFKQVLDWEELKALFTELGLNKLMTQDQESQEATSTGTISTGTPKEPLPS